MSRSLNKKLRTLLGLSLVTSGILAVSNESLGVTLGQFLAQVQERHSGIKSNVEYSEGSDLHREVGDTVLAPQLALQAAYFDDQKPNANDPYFIGLRSKGWAYTGDLTKVFGTGTSADLKMSLTQLTYTGQAAIPTVTTQNYDFGVGVASISLQQSLWKDSFGHATALRHQREFEVARSERATYDIQNKQLMIDAEAAFWDYLYLQEELTQREQSLARAHKIVTWIRERVANRINDRADLLNAEGLESNRDLDLISTKDEYAAAVQKIADFLQIDKSAVPAVEGNLAEARDLQSLVDGQGPHHVRLDSYLAVLQAKAKAAASSEVDESMKPDLAFSGSYATNSFDQVNGITGAYRQLYSENIPTTNLALKFTWLMDESIKKVNREAARSDALAANFTKERKLIESESGWNEMVRRHQELTHRVQAAQALAKVQKEKAQAQREKLARGRSITSDVVTAEQDQAESELLLAKLLVQQRKLESQAKMYLGMDGNL